MAIGRAIVRDARLFLFDEPLSNLDAQLRDEMRTEIKRLHQELGKTMVYVTHDQVEAMTLADRIVLLRDGAIAQEGRAIPLSGKGVTGACSAAHFGEHFVSECQAGPRGAAVDPAAGKPAPVAGTRSRQKNGPAQEGRTIF